MAGKSTGDLRPSKKLPESTHSVISNDDLLIEILLRLPILSLYLFKSVSKRWLSLIKTTNFTRKLDPPCGLFLLKLENSCHKYNFLPLDTRIPSCSSFTFGHNVPPGNLYILQSCNGLLLCLSVASNKLYVYNPSISGMYKMIPEPPGVKFDPWRWSISIMAFDPTKSPHYKVIHGVLKYDNGCGVWVQICIYSSETGVWSACEDRFDPDNLISLRYGVYWNDAIHWATFYCGQVLLCKLDILNECPVLTTSKAPFIFDRKDTFEYKLFNSRGCLLLFSKGKRDSKELYLYEMRSESSEWSVKYIVNLDDITVPLPQRWTVMSIVKCIYLGERDEDPFIVMKLSDKFVQYRIVSKTIRTLTNIEAETKFDGCFEYIASFANV